MPPFRSSISSFSANSEPLLRVTHFEDLVTLKIVPLLLASVVFTGCAMSTVATGPTQNDTKVIERDASQSAQVTLNMGAGDLKVSSGTEKLLRAYFTYNVPELRPDVHYSSSGGIGILNISEPETHGHIGNMKYEWDLRLDKEIPLDLNVRFGAGEGNLDLGSLDLRRVKVDMGVGQMQMDLRGAPKHDYDVSVHGGVGEADIKLPASVGIEATARGGIGEIDVHGLNKEGDRWVNDAYKNPGVKIHVDVQGGVGAIHLTAE
jgi:hypothetical protein